MIISRTPFRMSFVGGGTDLPCFYSREQGAVISASINKYVYVTVSRRFDKTLRISYSQTEIVDEVNDVRHPLFRETMRQTGVDSGIEVTSIADVPAGTGLGSSSSFTVGLLHALHAFKGSFQTAAELAETACHLEINVLGEPIGKQDHFAATCSTPTAACSWIRSSARLRRAPRYLSACCWSTWAVAGMRPRSSRNNPITPIKRWSTCANSAAWWIASGTFWFETEMFVSWASCCMKGGCVRSSWLIMSAHRESTIGTNALVPPAPWVGRCSEQAWADFCSLFAIRANRQRFGKVYANCAKCRSASSPRAAKSFTWEASNAAGVCILLFPRTGAMLPGSSLGEAGARG